jgi:hypothetical protein
MQVTARMDQDPVISQQLTLWNQQGSSVYRGNLLVIPIKEEVIYVQPIYLQATSGKLPELKRVIVAYHNRLAMETTLELSLRQVFRGSVPAAADGTIPQIAKPGDSPPAAKGIRELSRSAMKIYNNAVSAQRSGDWARYGEEIDRLKKELEALVKESEK